ncbi:MAG: hypothetical protein ACI8P3_002691, partial [Saprospiraceae bacterium]
GNQLIMMIVRLNNSGIVRKIKIKFKFDPEKL